MSIRPLIEADIPQVANLYWNHLRMRKGEAPSALRAVLHELCLESPFVDEAFHPIVFEAEDGRVGGFSGGIVRKMSLCGQPVRVIFGGSLVFHPDFRTGRIAPRLVETFFAQQADLAIVDSANELGRKVLLRNGFRIIPALNVHWMRPLRPAHYAVYGLSHLCGPRISAGLNLVSKPACWLADSIAARASSSIFRLKPSCLHGDELDSETLLECLGKFRNGYSLWTEYDLATLRWLIAFMERRAARGVLRKVVLRDDHDNIIGWYIYYVNPGAVGQVVQLGGSLDRSKEILDHLFYDAREHGVAGLHGVVEMRRIADFSDQHCFFTCRGGWTLARSAHPELLNFLQTDAWFTRLDGEWCLDPGE